jgi:uncharacterized LabA/DUF88 family protein
MSASTRVMVFLDGPNIYRGRERYNLLNNTVLTIDYHKLLNEAVRGRLLVRACFYMSKPVSPVDLDQVKFAEYLRKVGIQVHERELKEYKDLRTGEKKRKEKGVDVALATDVLSMAWEDAFDVAVLISGDADYVGAVGKVLSKGKNVEVMAFRGTLSEELRKIALRVIYLDDIVNAIQKL